MFVSFTLICGTLRCLALSNPLCNSRLCAKYKCLVFANLLFNSVLVGRCVNVLLLGTFILILRSFVRSNYAFMCRCKKTSLLLLSSSLSSNWWSRFSRVIIVVFNGRQYHAINNGYDWECLWVQYARKDWRDGGKKNRRGE